MAVTPVQITLKGVKRLEANTGDPIGNSAAVVAAQTTVDADVAVLVADGASPTQAHVTTLNTHMTTLDAAIAAASGNNLLGGADVVLLFDSTVVANNSNLRAFLRALTQLAAGGYGDLTN